MDDRLHVVKGAIRDCGVWLQAAVKDITSPITSLHSQPRPDMIHQGERGDQNQRRTNLPTSESHFWDRVGPDSNQNPLWHSSVTSI